MPIEHAEAQELICADPMGLWDDGHHSPVIVWDPALVTVVFYRDANHQTCAGGMIKCHGALSDFGLSHCE